MPNRRAAATASSEPPGAPSPALSRIPEAIVDATTAGKLARTPTIAVAAVRRRSWAKLIVIATPTTPASTAPREDVR